jgi:small-conductance mechanosensitive channel
MTFKRAVKLAALPALIVLALLIPACGTAPATPTATAALPPESVPALADEVSIEDVAEDVAEAVTERTPVPTPTPRPLARELNEWATVTGLAGRTFLGLPIEDWINLTTSVLIVALGYLVGVRLFYRLLKGIVRRTPTLFDDAFLSTIGGEFKWLVTVLLARYAIRHVGLFSDRLRMILDDVSFLLGLMLVVVIALKLINFAAQWYKDHLEPEKDRDRLDPVVLTMQRVAGVLFVVVGASIGLSHFGINITALSALILAGALVISMGARSIVADVVSGFLILLDQPFRVGDDILIEALDTWGEVTDIGTRSTHLLTRDNRVVIVPNSQIGESRVTNFSYPDPRYRAQVEIGVPYGSDFGRVRRVIQDAVRAVDGVLADRPVEALYLQFGDSARVMHVRWWVESIRLERRVRDQVNVAIERALDEAAIDIPFTRYDLNLKTEDSSTRRTPG